MSRWQSSTFEGLTGALHFENKSKTVSSRALPALFKIDTIHEVE